MTEARGGVEKVAQKLGRRISTVEFEFMTSVAFPRLDETTEDKALERLHDSLWDLCQWEQQRADVLDRKAYYLFGFSGIAATVLAVAGGTGGSVSLAAAFVILVFLVAVLLSLVTLRVVGYGGFLDEDVFEALRAHARPVGDLPQFKDSDVYRCFLRESSLQRWLVYRWYATANDRKASQLAKAQLVAALGLVSLVVLLLFTPFGLVPGVDTPINTGGGIS